MLCFFSLGIAAVSIPFMLDEANMKMCVIHFFLSECTADLVSRNWECNSTGTLVGIVYRLDSAQRTDICAAFLVMFHHHLLAKGQDLKLKTDIN